MLFCKKCGTKLYEGTAFCPKCGEPTEAKSTEDNVMHSEQVNNQNQSYIQQEMYNDRQAERIDTTGLLVWSIINIFLCWPFSIYSILTLKKVNKVDSKEEAERLFKNAKITCIIASCIGVFLFIIGLIGY